MNLIKNFLNIKKDMVKPEKCSVCKKRSYVNIKCRCDKVVCMTHRHHTDHECTFDYQEFGKDILTKQNPIVKGEKISVI